MKRRKSTCLQRGKGRKEEGQKGDMFAKGEEKEGGRAER